MERLFHKLTTVLLGTAILAGSLLSPGVRHAHSRGEVPHSHRAVVVPNDARHEHHGHEHAKSHAHHGNYRHESQPPSRERLADHASHWHISLLGFDFTFPQQGEPNEPLTPYDEGQLVVLRLTPDFVVSFAAAFADVVDLSAGTAVSVDRSDAEAAPSAGILARPVDRILLCDTARCERSGVLLI